MAIGRTSCILGFWGLWFTLAASDGSSISGTRVEVPITVLRQRADVIVLASLSRIDRSDPAPETVQLEVLRLIQGQEPAISLSAQLPRPAQLPTLSLPDSSVGQSGIWFLKRASSGYVVLPLIDGLHVQTEFFLPNSDSAAALAPSGTVDQQLLAYLVRWHLSVSNPGSYEDARLFASFDRANQQDALRALSGLLSSVSTPHRLVGLAAAIRVGSLDALTALLSEVPALEGSPKSPDIVQALELYYQPTGVSAIAPLQQLIALHPGVPGLEAAVAAALRKIGTKAIAPAMARLLDSQDPAAQLAGAAFFGTYSLFADASGNFPSSGPIGPFATNDTRQFAPRNNSGLTPAEYAQFWKSWWSANYIKLGFSMP